MKRVVEEDFIQRPKRIWNQMEFGAIADFYTAKKKKDEMLIACNVIQIGSL